MCSASFLVAITFTGEMGDVRRSDTPRQRIRSSAWFQ
jgi:hypothetical protein